MTAICQQSVTGNKLGELSKHLHPFLNYLNIRDMVVHSLPTKKTVRKRKESKGDYQASLYVPKKPQECTKNAFSYR